MSASPGQRRPNLLLITTDQQRYDSLSASGNPVVRTPHLDALARRGVLFRRGYTQSPICIPSRACIMTGRYVHQHGVEYMEEVIGSTPGLPPWEISLMERLRASGYRTAAFGKIHMLPPRGLDETALTMGKGARWTVADGSPLGPSQLGPVYARWLEEKRPGAYESIYAQRRRPEYAEQATAVVNTLAADEYVDWWVGESTCGYLNRPDVAGAERPFFVWCGFCGPHPPYDPPEPYASLYDPHALPLPPLLHARQRNVPERGASRPFDRPDGERLARRILAHYWGMVTLIDDMVGRICEVLSRRALWQNTLVVFTSDHGDMLGDFGRLNKENFFEGVIHVPYIVVPPGSDGVAGAAPTRVDDLVAHIDLAPTILDYAGLAHPPELPGVSLRPRLEGGLPARAASAAKEAVLCEYVSGDRRSRGKCLRTDRYKYVFWGADRPVEFYDLHEDPHELVNVAGAAAYRAEIERHASLLLHRLTWSERNAWNSGAAAACPTRVDRFGLPCA